jgi:hypothetical protein
MLQALLFNYFDKRKRRMPKWLKVVYHAVVAALAAIGAALGLSE